MDLTIAVLGQDRDLPLSRALEMVRGVRGEALALFPGKERAFDLIYRPRFRRVLEERYRVRLLPGWDGGPVPQRKGGP